MIEIPLTIHVDAVGHESFVQVKAANPTNCEIFTKFRCSKPEICAGFVGKEKNLQDHMLEVLEKIIIACRKFYIFYKILPKTEMGIS